MIRTDKSLQRSREIYDSLINHLFLPLSLPVSAEADYCSRHNHEHEYMILESLQEFFNSYNDTKTMLPVIQTVIDCVERWKEIQNIRRLSINHLQTTIKALPMGASLPIYLFAQNAAIFIEVDEHNLDRIYISSWPVLLPTDVVVSSFFMQQATFPVNRYQLKNRTQICSTTQCELLFDLMINTIEHAKFYRHERLFTEAGEVPSSHFVWNWWVQQLSGVSVEDTEQSGLKFKKKYRDQIRSNNYSTPFRRSGLWITIKVILQILITKSLGEEGIMVYKLLITQFLTSMLYKRELHMESKLSKDLIIFCIRKLLRRLNKIDELRSKISNKDIINWFDSTKNTILKCLDELLPKFEWQIDHQYTILKNNEESSEIRRSLNDLIHYTYECGHIQTYVNSIESSYHDQSSRELKLSLEQVEDESFNYVPCISHLTGERDYKIGTAIAYLELWIIQWTSNWLNQEASNQKQTERFQTLKNVIDDYHNAALNYYCSDEHLINPIGYSRFIIISLTVIQAMHHKLCQDKKIERLLLHQINIPNVLEIFEYLVLVHRDDMIRAQNLYNYFSGFQQAKQPDILTSIDEETSFGVQFASNSHKMQKCLSTIQNQIERDKRIKLEEIKAAKEKYHRLMNSVNSLPCTCYRELDSCLCRRCRIEQQAKSIQVNIYECPMPSTKTGALAVIFELRMPLEIRCYREVLWQFINRSRTVSHVRRYEWLQVRPHGLKLESFYTGPKDCKVKLVSSTNSVSSLVNFVPNISLSSVDEYFHENSLLIELTPAQSTSLETERRRLTPIISQSDYKHLQFTIESTAHTQNEVISYLSHTKHDLEQSQFIQFGSFRSGHLLQWWNLLAVLETESLPLNEESVIIMIKHALYQNGPVDNYHSKPTDKAWCPEAHEIIQQDSFIDELFAVLKHHLNDISSSWDNCLELYLISTIAVRLLTLSSRTKEKSILDIIGKCRYICDKWINQMLCLKERFEKNILKTMITITCAAVTTYSSDHDRVHLMIGSDNDMILLLKFIKCLYENIDIYESQLQSDMLLRDEIKNVEYTLVCIQPYISEYLKKTACKSLDSFVLMEKMINNQNNHIITGRWIKRRKDQYDGWYDGYYGTSVISIDFLRGQCLIDGLRASRLPEKLRKNNTYLHLFGDLELPMRLAKNRHNYITRSVYHEDNELVYEFQSDERYDGISIREIQIKTNKKCFLIPQKLLEIGLPKKLINEYSHWKIVDSQLIEFRPLNFDDPNFLSQRHYTLNLETGIIHTDSSANEKILIHPSSPFFQYWFTRYFHRLDEQHYVYMTKDITSERIHAHLSRLDLGFYFDVQEECFVSREFSNLRIDHDQTLGTLIGLRSSLLLSPMRRHKTNERNPLEYRTLIVPYGKVTAKQHTINEHQIVNIQRTTSMQYSNQYFIFKLNDRLKVLQATENPTAWLYLVLLHAQTSNPCPDPFTGMTGMERAFQILNSAVCSTDRPIDSLESEILYQIAMISPQVEICKQHSISMQRIHWKENTIPHTLQHPGYYLIIQELISVSEAFNFMHLCDQSMKTDQNSELHSYDTCALFKLYWDYREYINPIARLSSELEKKLLTHVQKYDYTPAFPKPTVNHFNLQSCRIHDIYKSGDLRLKDAEELRCFPLQRWLQLEFRLDAVWIGLLKCISSIKMMSAHEHQLNTERFEVLLQFLYYISGDLQQHRYCLNVLHTILFLPELSWKQIVFPPFTQYYKIEQVTATLNTIDRLTNRSANERRVIMEEVRDCLEAGHMFKNNCRLANSEEKQQIKFLLNCWHLNRRLRNFLDSLQQLVDKFQIIEIIKTLNTQPQKFTIHKSNIQRKLKPKLSGCQINDKILDQAEKKFFHKNTEKFFQETSAIEKQYASVQFPDEIFNDMGNINDELPEITEYFKQNLMKSWNSLQSIQQFEKHYSTIDDIESRLTSYRDQSHQFLTELYETIMSKNEIEFAVGLLPRLNPTILISEFEKLWSSMGEDNSLNLLQTVEHRTLLGGIMVNWVIEQQLERALSLASQEKYDEYYQELSNPPHFNWIPNDNLLWLIFELETNITIRPMQVSVAEHMSQLPKSLSTTSALNMVTQMNMGEGKTSVIIPMLILRLSQSNVVMTRIIILRSLLLLTYNALRIKLGVLLNRKVLTFKCRRDIDFSHAHVCQTLQRFNRGLRHRDVLLASPEDILSFDLLTIDKCRRGDFETARSMLQIQYWTKHFIRDVFDESDEILHWKYQLIYTVGSKQTLDYGIERWRLIQEVLEIMKNIAPNFTKKYPDCVQHQIADRGSSFGEFRFLSDIPFHELTVIILRHWLLQRSYRSRDIQKITSFVLDVKSSIGMLNEDFPTNEIQMLLLLRGLLSYEVLLFALKKRYRVHYGINTSSTCETLMAVPFRAKDVATERTEFGHPDMAIVLTQLSYYYKGLTESQIQQCLKRLSTEERDPQSIYDQWLSTENDNTVPKTIRQWKGINQKGNKDQFNQLLSLLKYNMQVINYFLNNFVYLKEIKQYPNKLVANAWDLSCPSKTIVMTGFSGTSDTQLLLPLHVTQDDLPNLKHTDALVITHLLKPQNNNYFSIAEDITVNDLLKTIASYGCMINVILDVGALFIDGTNCSIAMRWLDLTSSEDIEYAVYFESDQILVCDRHYNHRQFISSPAHERMDRCIFYIDEVHTRGVDFKFPVHFKALVTLGNGLTRDRLVQGCMRMRGLGYGHSLVFCSSPEVHRRILVLRRRTLHVNAQEDDSVPVAQNACSVHDILRWAYHNTIETIWNGFNHWAIQSINFQHKKTALESIDWNNLEEVGDDQVLSTMAERCLETEALNLEDMYGRSKELQTVVEIFRDPIKYATIDMNDNMQKGVIERLQMYGGSRTRLGHIVDEGHQREIEQELQQEEERILEHHYDIFPKLDPCEPSIHDLFYQFLDPDEVDIDIHEHPDAVALLPDAFKHTKLFDICQYDCWSDNLWITRDFQNVIKNKEVALDRFLRPPRWVITYRNSHVILISPFEANWLMKELNDENTASISLRMLLPRTKKKQSIFVNNRHLIIPFHDENFQLPLEWLVQLFIFNGTMYFDSNDEQKSYCECCALSLKPRSHEEEFAYENGFIMTDGFIENSEYRRKLGFHNSRFRYNPLEFIKQMLKVRHGIHPFLNTHVGNIIYRTMKSVSDC